MNRGRRLLLVALISCVVMAMALSRTSASEVEATVEKYVTKGEVLGDVLYSLLPSESQKDLPLAYRELREIYPIGSPRFLSFDHAWWLLASDGAAAVEVELPRPGAARERVLLSGHWDRGKSQVHLVGRGLFGLRVAVDGLLRPAGDGYRLDGICAVSVRGARHAERVALRLATSPDPHLPEEGKAALEEYRQKMRTTDTARVKPILSEPSEIIGGIPVPTAYDATIRVKLDGVELPPLAGQVLLNKVREGSAPPSVGLTIATDGPVAPGWSAWITNPETGPYPKGQVVASDGRLHVTVTPSARLQPMSWWTRNRANPGEVVRVVAERGTIDVQATGDSITATITAVGAVDDVTHSGRRQSGTFEAHLSGKRQGGDFVRAIAEFVGARSFSGTWRDARLGELKLTQDERAVAGTAAGARIEGIATGTVLDFSWRGAARHGNGFLSAATNGVLVGLKWETGDLSHPQPIVAEQALPGAETAARSANLPAPANDAQAMELKYLGQDLYHAGKYQEATAILDKVVAYYAARARESAKDPAASGSYLVNQVLPLLSLMDAASEAGDYPVLVKALSNSVKVQRELGRDAVALRSFRDQARKYLNDIGGRAATLGNLAAAFERGIEFVTASGVGVGFEEGGSSGIRIYQVTPGGPAERAGLLPGDEVVAIEGAAATGMDIEAASRSLRGEPGAPVAVTVSRGGRAETVKLVRAPLNKMGPQRREAMSRGLAALSAETAALSRYLASDGASLESALQALEAPSGTRPAADGALIELADRIERLQLKLSSGRRRVVELGSECLAGTPPAGDLFVRFVALQDERIKKSNLSEENLAAVEKLDRDEEEFAKSGEASELEKQVLKLSMITLGELDSLAVQAAGRARLVKGEATPSPAELRAELSRELGFDLGPDTGADRIEKQLAALSVRLDLWRSKLGTDAARIESLQYGVGFYDDYVTTLADLGKADLALLASESARARAFQDLLAGKRPDRGSFEPTAPLQALQAAPPLTLEKMRALVKERRSTVVEYMTTKTELLIWVVSPSGTVSMIRRPLKANALRQTINTFLQLVEPKPGPVEAQKERRELMNRVLRELHGELLQPIPPGLLPDNAEEPVTFIPHGELFRVPFNVLVDESGEYFVSRHAPVFSVALSVMEYTRHNKAKAPREGQGRMLAVVNPKPLPDNLAALDQTERNFQALLPFYPGTDANDILAGTEATKANLKKRLASSKHSVIYFATHGSIDDSDVLKSYIAMANPTAGEEGEDGRLKIAEIFALDLRSDLSVLSACKTGRGGVSVDGVNGLSRAFVWSGAASLLTSLWSIPEMPSMQQVYDFLLYRGKGYHKAGALRMAQRKAMASYPDQPDLWGGFQLYGEWE